MYTKMLAVKGYYLSNSPSFTIKADDVTDRVLTAY